MRSTAENAQLALLLEVTATPKPGNVDRTHDHKDLRFEHFMAGAVGASEGLEMAANGAPIGESFECAVAGMAEQEGGNTQFGALLALVPLVATTHRAELSPERVTVCVESTTVADAAGFYRAFEHVDVAVDDPPDGMDALDVRRGGDAIPALREREMTLYDVLAASSERDGIAREWISGFSRSFAAADRIESDEGSVPEHAARAYLELLAEEPDTFVATTHDEATAQEVCEAARAARRGETTADALADRLVAEGVNPGTTADLTAAGLFIALEGGLSV